MMSEEAQAFYEIKIFKKKIVFSFICILSLFFNFFYLALVLSSHPLLLFTLLFLLCVSSGDQRAQETKIEMTMKNYNLGGKLVKITTLNYKINVPKRGF